LAISADISSVQLLQNLFVVIIGTNDLILDGYHKSSSFWEEFISLSQCVCKLRGM